MLLNDYELEQKINAAFRPFKKDNVAVTKASHEQMLSNLIAALPPEYGIESEERDGTITFTLKYSGVDGKVNQRIITYSAYSLNERVVNLVSQFHGEINDSETHKQMKDALTNEIGATNVNVWASPEDVDNHTVRFTYNVNGKTYNGFMTRSGVNLV